MPDENVLVRDPDDWRKWFCTDETVKIIAKEPHKLGWLIGYEDLVPLHSEWIKYIWDTNENRALQAFRGSYKSSSISVTGAIRWMLFRPNDRILLTRKTYTAAYEVVKSISQAMQLQQILELFKFVHGKYPVPVVDREGSLRYSFKSTITPEGNMTASGIDVKTGSHYEKIIWDDGVTIRDRISKAERLRTIEMLREILTNIIDPGHGVGMIGTPWHREDAWKIVRSFCPIAQYPLSQYGIQHGIITQDEINRKKKTTTPYLYAANYELELGKDESLLFTDPIMSNGWNYNVRGVVAHVDAAYDGDCFCALTIVSKLRGNGEETYYQAVGFTYNGNIINWYDEIYRLCQKYNVECLYEETNADKGMSARDLSARGINMRTYSEGMNKHIKISTILFKVWEYIEWAPDTDDEYMTQVMDYKAGIKPDDAPDSAASLFREAFGSGIELSAEERARFKWKK